MTKGSKAIKKRGVMKRTGKAKAVKKTTQAEYAKVVHHALTLLRKSGFLRGRREKRAVNVLLREMDKPHSSKP